jgi:wyosine [tRNA(Phe)-imidazoG37] synthetase (radical SAM superfamily)
MGNPTFVEVKGYMRLGASRKYHAFEHMPEHEIVMAFAKQLEKILPDYEIVAEHKTSRAVCLIKKSMNKKRFIDFKKFFSFVNNPKNKGKEISAEVYSAKTMRPN